MDIANLGLFSCKSFVGIATKELSQANGHGGQLILIMSLAMPVSPYPTPPADASLREFHVNGLRSTTMLESSNSRLL
ncbi:MAG: hypothetical protein FD121_331 [Gallionellaceae bacterium]|nr:MAG: hypothetical protein FD121_331 [Gallionellaceae bacterium]